MNFGYPVQVVSVCLAPRAPRLLGGRPLGTCGCPAAGATVCGSDGRTYRSLCALRAENRAARLRGALPAVPVQKGDCGDPGEPRARSRRPLLASLTSEFPSRGLQPAPPGCFAKGSQCLRAPDFIPSLSVAAQG